MLNKILVTLMTVGLIIAVIVGMYFRQSYTNITAQPNFLEKHFKVALWDNEINPDLPKVMKNELPKSNIIIRAKSIGSDFSFNSFLQNVEI